MLRNGKEHLESLRDGRVVYVGGERIDDVTRHPAFRMAAETVAAIFDMKADPANRDAMSYEEEGGRHSIYFLRAKTRDDLQRRSNVHKKIADLTFGMFGRSPDHVASFVTGMAMKPAVVAPCGHAQNLLAYYRRARNDIHRRGGAAERRAARVLIARTSSADAAGGRRDDAGVTIPGMKCWRPPATPADRIGNVCQLAPDQKKEASPRDRAMRRAGAVVTEADGGRRRLRVRFAARGATASDSMLLCDSARAVGEVFVHDDALCATSSSPSHCFGNHQSNVRYWSNAAAARPVQPDRAGDRRRQSTRERSARMAAIGATIGGGTARSTRLRLAGGRLLQPPHRVAGLEWCTQNYSRVHRRAAHPGGGVVSDAGRHLSAAGRGLAAQFFDYWQARRATRLAG